jgi:hypothetical protein
MFIEHSLKIMMFSKNFLKVSLCCDFLALHVLFC